MNLHGIAGPMVSSVNPTLRVGVQVNVGYATAVDGTRTPTFATPGSIQASISGTTLTVALVAGGVLQRGQMLADQDGIVAPGTQVVGYGTGDGAAGTYAVNISQDVAQEQMTTYAVANAQVQPESFRDIQQLDGLNLNGTRKVFYLYGRLDGLVRPGKKGGDLITMPDGSVWLVVLVMENFSETAGWTKCAATLQNDVPLMQAEAQSAPLPLGVA